LSRRYGAPGRCDARTLRCAGHVLATLFPRGRLACPFAGAAVLMLRPCGQGKMPRRILSHLLHDYDGCVCMLFGGIFGGFSMKRKALTQRAQRKDRREVTAETQSLQRKPVRLRLGDGRSLRVEGGSRAIMWDANCASESRPTSTDAWHDGNLSSASTLEKKQVPTAIRKVRGWVRDDSEKLSPQP
jgi:hypothetical protein